VTFTLTVTGRRGAREVLPGYPSRPAAQSGAVTALRRAGITVSGREAATIRSLLAVRPLGTPCKHPPTGYTFTITED
jgi:hypothetical protein